MRYIGAVVAGVLVAGTAGAGDWTALDDAGIRAALTDQRVQYADAWQEFRGDGRTLYNAGSDSWGGWRASGDRYCSIWPPASEWECYTVETDGADGIRFISRGGYITEGRFDGETG